MEWGKGSVSEGVWEGSNVGREYFLRMTQLVGDVEEKLSSLVRDFESTSGEEANG